MNFLFWFLNVVVVTLLICLLWYSKRKTLYNLAKRIDGPDSWPILGTLPRFIGKDNEQILEDLTDLMQEYSSPVKIWFGPMLTLIVDKAENLKMVLNSQNCFEKAYLYNFLILKFGLMVETSESHSRN